MSDINKYGRLIMQGYCYTTSCCNEGKLDRSFLTKEEKIDMLREYKESLDKESQGVAERIKNLSG